MKNILILLLTAIIFTGCIKLNIEKDTPKCIASEIKSFNKSSDCSSMKVDEYTYQGNTVYTFDPGTCGADMTTEVMDADCNSLGYLGGIAGNTEINGEDFSSAIYVKTIWEK